MSKNTSIVHFQHFLNELWAFENSHLLKNEIRVLKVQEVNTLSKLVAVVMKVVGYTNYELIHN